MPPSSGVRLTGYRELLRACDHAGKDTKREVRATFRGTGEAIRARGQELFGAIDAHSAAGYRVRVRQRGVAVEQSLRRTTGKRPDYGALQMRVALVPALEEEKNDLIDRLDKAMDEVAARFNH